MAVSEDDLVLRTANIEPNKSAANSYLALDESEEVIKFRMDAGLWEGQTEDIKVRALVSAYKDINRLTWQTYGGQSQSRDYEFEMRFTDFNEPPLDDAEFLIYVKQAQVVQALYILAGTQVRDMAREGIRMSRALSGAEMEFTGYRGAVCSEAIELIAKWVILYPQMRRF